MTADERIEKLMNRFGQTISDLPDRRGDIPDGLYVNTLKKIGQEGYQDCVRYALHLTDLIDRMETAMQNAAIYVPKSIERDTHKDYSVFNAYVKKRFLESGMIQARYAEKVGVDRVRLNMAIHNARKLPDWFYKAVYSAHGDDFEKARRG